MEMHCCKKQEPGCNSTGFDVLHLGMLLRQTSCAAYRTSSEDTWLPLDGEVNCAGRRWVGLGDSITLAGCYWGKTRKPEEPTM